MAAVARALFEGPVASNVRVKHGFIRAHRYGDAPSGAEGVRVSTGPLVICVHGLSANSRGFDPMPSHLVEKTGRRVVAIDLRGRGYSIEERFSS